MLEQRVANVERDMSRVLGILERLEPRLIEVLATSAKQNDLMSLGGELGEIKGRIKGIEDRFGSIPTTWQIVSILAVLLIGIAGIVFTAGKFWHP